MDIRKGLLSLLATLSVSISASAQYIRVSDTYTAQQLVENVLVTNQCASVSNINVSGGNFSSGAKSYGYFNANGSRFPMTDGVILSTGRAVMAVGPNTSLLDDGGNMGWNGDNDLQQALNITNSTNATVLEFDFIPLTNNISFTYMLASEEYHDNAPCRYSDGFAFLLKEADNPAAAYTNLAVVPNTNIPVKVTSVHPFIGGSSGCPAVNEEYFDAFNDTEYPTNFNGQTKVMTAKSGVTPGLKYHIKLVIADESNYRYDSAIFLGGSSFESTIDLGPSRTRATNNPLCFGEHYNLNAAVIGATAYQWYKDGRVISGATNATYVLDTEGIYKVEVQFSPTCTIHGEVTIQYSAPVNLGNSTLLQCDADGDGLTVYNLQQAGDLARGGDTNLQVMRYFTSLADAQANTNYIQNITAFENTTPLQPIYVLVTNQYGCSGIATVTLGTSTNILAPYVYGQCDDTDGKQDGLSKFNVTVLYPMILNGLPSSYEVRLYNTYNDALTNTNRIATPEAFVTTTVASQTVYARVGPTTDCYGIKPLILETYTFDAIPEETVFMCTGTPVTLDAGMQYTNFIWDTTPAQNTRQITVSAPGKYTVSMNNTNNCNGTKVFNVIESGRATITGIDINDFNGGNNTVTINTTGAGIYEYSIDGINWYDSNIFTNVETGIYIVYVRDTQRCGTVTKEIFVLDYPKYFTPNADGNHDVWHIPYLAKRPTVKVHIYDRYGKLIYMFLGNSSTGWDGTYHGHPLPATDYWFTITLENGKLIRGHFALIR